MSSEAAANLSHPNIVNIYDWGRDGEAYYIVMEFVAGTDLKTLVTERGPLDPAKAAEYASQVCAALSVAHGYDIIHRDIKPHNIVLTPDGGVKVMDFGIARAGNTTMTQTGSVLGTAQYISPEQAQGRPLTPASDLYSLGVTLYELVTGRVPFDGDSPVATALMQVNDTPTPPRQIRGSIPPGLEAVILRSLRKDPAERYASAAEMREDLKRVIGGEPAIGGAYGGSSESDRTSVLPAVERTSTPRTAVAPQVRQIPERRTSPWVWVLAIVVLIALGLGGAYALGYLGPSGIVVPTLTGLDEAGAEAALAQAGLVLGERGTANDNDVAIGLIISQDPPAGEEVEEGTAVNIVISMGIAQVEVPNLVDQTEADAIGVLRADGSGLDYDRTIGEYNADVEKGVVIRTEPEAGAQVPEGTRVILYVSLGVEQVKVPDVVGKPVADATADLKAAGLEVKTNEVFDDTAAVGLVISQSPDGNVLVEMGSTVTIEVSKGPEIILVPDVRDKTEQEAKDLIVAAGLTPNVVYVDSLDDGLVVNQFPIPGASASRGDVVEIEVGKLPEEP